MIAHDHLVIVPVVLPLAAGAIMLVIDERRLAVKAAISIGAALALVGVGLALIRIATPLGATVYRVGNWPAPFGIVLVLDRLSAVMVLLAAVLGVASLVFSLARWQRAGPRFHSLVQFLLMGVNGAFLTGDLFNLFVFFEVLLAASYGLALHGSGALRVRASLHYITMNLAASLLFLIGASLIYGATGTLNMADLAQRWRESLIGDRTLFEVGGAILGIAFLVKAGMWPLCFWLPGAYSAASAPAGALFAILTKVGVYAVLRTGTLFLGVEVAASPSPGTPWLVAAGMATLAFGTLGVLASQSLSRLASYSVLVSSGTLLAVIALGKPALTGAALYYLVVSTLALSAFFLLVELVERGRTPGADVLAVTAEAFGTEQQDDDEPTGIAIPAATALLGLAFASCAIMLAGLPPLAGFVGKFAMLHALLEPRPVPVTSWTMLALLVGSGFATIVAMGRAGVRRFWATPDMRAPRVRMVELIPIVVLLALCVGLTVQAGPSLRYLEQAAQMLHAPAAYVHGVLSAR
ncbi:MAG TPA: monovalent cation/H+ antiporter subunit D [Casimicrobiaceae bacterium]|nr:monovalent cation/H+ antiporter subunit D [Casimicrobiaceae bacterium]